MQGGEGGARDAHAALARALVVPPLTCGKSKRQQNREDIKGKAVVVKIKGKAVVFHVQHKEWVGKGGAGVCVAPAYVAPLRSVCVPCPSLRLFNHCPSYTPP